MIARRFGQAMTGLVLALVVLTSSRPLAAVPAVPKVGHFFTIVLENEGFRVTFGPKSPARYLRWLARQGALLPYYYAIGHFSLDNYIAMISGQAPNPVTQSNCQSYVEFVQSGIGKDGQVIGSGCVYPATVITIADQLQAKGLTWKAYMEDMGNNPNRESATCGHPPLGQADGTEQAVVGDQYATRHNPFMYFHSIIDKPSCAANVVALPLLAANLRAIETTPNYAFITPNLCHDGHDGDGKSKTCVDGESGGLVSADKFLSETVPMILSSPAFKKDGLLIVTFDEADVEVKVDASTHQVHFQSGDATACCNERPGPNIGSGATVFGEPDRGPGITGAGGGRIGAVVLSPFIKPGTISHRYYNHYALLRSIEDLLGLDHLGYSAQRGLRPFGADVFTNFKPDLRH